MISETITRFLRHNPRREFNQKFLARFKQELVELIAENERLSLENESLKQRPKRGRPRKDLIVDAHLIEVKSNQSA